MLNITTIWRGLDVRAAQAALGPGQLEPSVVDAARIGEAALRAEVSKIGRVTGNLEASIATRLGRDSAGRVYAEVGFFGEKANHAHLVEFGTGIRFRSGTRAASSWNARGRWAGVGVYPANFVTRAANLGAMPALHPLENASRNGMAGMKAAMEQKLAAVGEKSLDAATG